jgi:hypothetical protein
LLEYISGQLDDDDDDDDEGDFEGGQDWLRQDVEVEFSVGEDRNDMESENAAWLARSGATIKDTVPAPAPATPLAGRSVGIDLGTTYSSVSIIEGGVPVIIPLDGARIVRSVVGYLPGGKVLVGEAAHRQMAVNPANTYASVKRVIGRTLRQLKESGYDSNTNKDGNANSDTNEDSDANSDTFSDS